MHQQRGKGMSKMSAANKIEYQSRISKKGEKGRTSDILVRGRQKLHRREAAFLGALVVDVI